MSKGRFRPSFFYGVKNMKKIISITLVIIIIIASIPVQSVYAFTPEEFIGNLDWSKMTKTEKWGCVFNFTVAEIKAVVNGDAKSFIQGMAAMQEYMNNNEPDNFVNEDNITIPKEYIALVKQCIYEYLKTEQTKEENGGFFLLPTTKYIDVPANSFTNSFQYQTFRNIVLEKGLLAVYTKNTPILFVDPFSDPDHPILLVGSSANLDRLETLPYMPVSCSYFCAYDWKYEKYRTKSFPESGHVYTSVSDSVNFNYSNVLFEYNTSAFMNWDVKNHGNLSDDWTLYSTTGEMIRVFISQNAAKNYSVGNRKVFVTQNFYDYEPEDLTVSIDDLQKSVDDLQKIIDELLKRVTDKTSEKEIMELLRLILEELRKNPGGGGSSSGGDVTVSVDLQETNSWLSKIFSKVSQIYEKMNSAVEDAEDAAIAKIQESLDEIIVQLKKIKGWAAVDTVIDGVDAVADWLDLIYDVLKNGAGSAVAALSSALGESTDLMKQKFPFSMPWDILFFVSVLSAEPETPHFVIPFNFEYPALDLAVDYEMELDFTPLQWLSDLSRLILSMTYAVGLMKKTLDIVTANKEG